MDLSEGWGLQKERKVVPFDSTVVARLTELYDEGERTKKKLNQHQAERIIRMERNVDGSRRFAEDKILNANQIRGLFGRLTQKRAQKIKDPAVEDPLINEGDDIDEDYDNQPDAFEALYNDIRPHIE